MTAENSQTIYLKDYQEPAYLVEHVALEFAGQIRTAAARSSFCTEKT